MGNRTYDPADPNRHVLHRPQPTSPFNHASTTTAQCVIQHQLLITTHMEAFKQDLVLRRGEFPLRLTYLPDGVGLGEMKLRNAVMQALEIHRSTTTRRQPKRR